MDVSVNEVRFYAIVFRLVALRSGAVTADHGDQARAALFDLIQRSDFPLAAKLHDSNDHKPYTISLVQGGKRGSDSARHFAEGDSAEWRFTLLHEPAFEALLQRYLRDRALPHIRIGVLPFGIEAAYASGIGHPQSGYTTLTLLRERWSVANDSLPPSFILNFSSPTGFSLGQDKVTREHRWRAMPEPRLIFSALRKKWTRLGGVDPGDSFDEWVDRTIEAEPLHLESRATVVEQRHLRGFVGRVRFRPQGDLRWWSLVHLLADLAFWTGVGYQTTRGMGQVRKEPPAQTQGG